MTALADEEGHAPILANIALTSGRLRVLQQDDTFGVFDQHGEVGHESPTAEGLYFQGTRFLSRFLLQLHGSRPLVLRSTILGDNVQFSADLMNPVLEVGGALVPHGVVHLYRTMFLLDGVCHQRLRLVNYEDDPLSVTLGIEAAADFADIFEVRGSPREERGEYRPPRSGSDTLVFSYMGRDEVTRRTQLTFRPPPKVVEEGAARYELDLRPREPVVLETSVVCSTDEGSPPVTGYDDGLERARGRNEELGRNHCRISSRSERFDAWTGQSLADLKMLTSRVSTGWYPFAGVPWFNTPFGRDGIVTALECLSIMPFLARGVLRFLAATQATEIRPEKDAEPGKILHEARKGEMARLGEIPFARYYGSVDATPLFVVLAGRYHKRTGDLELAEQLWPHVVHALEWIEEFGDLDGDGFVEYERRAAEGLENQGWKDSEDSIFHADGTDAQGPIALCEVQAYVYRARLEAADLAEALGREGAARQREEAARLRRQFDDAFWCPELHSYALALDGKKRPCRVRTSNAGHALYAGIASPARAEQLAETLMSEASFNGWGIRTLGAGSARYNPMAYHNGSVWPHDTSLVADGLARYGYKEEAVRLLDALFRASQYVDQYRLPELMCGFARQPEAGPTQYPVACIPQAWSAGSVFLLLEACLGMRIDGRKARIRFDRPVLPGFLPEVEFDQLAVGEARIDLTLVRHEQDVGINVRRREGELDLEIRK